MQKKSLLLAMTVACFTGSVFAKANPRDGLSADEIKQVKTLLLESKTADDKTLYPLFELVEPEKSAVYAWRDGGKMPPRRVLVQFKKSDGFYTTVVNLSEKKVGEVKKTTGQPMILLDEFFAASSLVLKLVRRPITTNA